MNWAFPLAIAIFAAVLGFMGEEARLLLRFDRPGIIAGQWWRLASGHFVHLGWSHAVLNGAGLGLVWLLVGSAFGFRYWAMVLAVCVAGTSAGLWWLSPQVGWYVGLSGLLHGLLVAGLIARLRPAPIESLALLAAVGVKLAFEQFSGPLPGTESASGGPVVIDAHLYGALSGLAASLPIAIRDFRSPAI